MPSLWPVNCQDKKISKADKNESTKGENKGAFKKKNYAMVSVSSALNT